MHLTAAQLSALLEGLDWPRPRRARDGSADAGQLICDTANQLHQNARDAVGLVF